MEKKLDLRKLWPYLAAENRRIREAVVSDKMSPAERLYRARYIQNYIQELGKYGNVLPYLSLAPIREMAELGKGLEEKLLEQYASSNPKGGNLVFA